MAAEHSGNISPGGGGQSSAPSLPNNVPDGAGASGANAGARLIGVASSETTRGDANNSQSEEVLEISYEPGSKGSRGTIRWADGDVYEGELKDGEPHGKGSCRYSSADGVRIAYDGNWKDGWRERGKLTYQSGDVYDGQWGENGQHGHGTYTWDSGTVYDGDWEDGKRHGRGTFTYTNGNVYEGELNAGKRHGRGVLTTAAGKVYDGEWRDDLHHGKGSLKWASGGVYVGEFAEGKMHGWGEMTYADGDKIEGKWADGEHDASCKEVRGASDSDPKASRAYNERMLRSHQSQQQRLEAATKHCECCGVDDYQYKLRVCSGCNMALYCSAACQKAATKSHRRICNIILDLPERDSDRLILRYDRGKMVDLDAGLRYATKYMSNLKHLTIDIKEMASNDGLRLSTKHISSLLKSKKRALDSFFWKTNAYSTDISVPGVSKNGDAVWKELYGLRRLRLEGMTFDDVQSVRDIVCQQHDTLQLLSLKYLQIDWHRSKCRRTFAQTISSCKSLVTLDLAGCVMTDSDLKVMLQDLPNLRILYLQRYWKHRHEFTDNTCGFLARKCPGLQELSLVNHNQLSVRGIRKIFEGCIHLRSFYTSTRKLSCKDVQSLLAVAPQLMILHFGDEVGVSNEELDKIIDATGGRTVFRIGSGWHGPEGEVISSNARKKYDSQIDTLRKMWSHQTDPAVTNEWAGVFEG